MNNLINVLIVEDESAIRNLLSTALETNGYNYETATNGTMALSLLTKHQFDIILLDLGLPDLDGIDIIKKLRTFSFTPIIVISARSNDDDKITALDIGADDYLTKPFSVEELLARIEVVFRRESNPKDSIFKFKDITIDTKSRIVKRNNEEINLTNKEYELLMILIENKDEVVTRDELLERIWGYDTETNVTDVYIRHLRSKLNNENKEEYIQTVRSIGYIMRS